MENKFTTYNISNDAKTSFTHSFINENRCWSDSHVSENRPFGINDKKVQTARAIPLREILKSPFIS